MKLELCLCATVFMTSCFQCPAGRTAGALCASSGVPYSTPAQPFPAGSYTSPPLPPSLNNTVIFAPMATSVAPGVCEGMDLLFLTDSIANFKEDFALSSSSASGTFYKDSACKIPTSVATVEPSNPGSAPAVSLYYANSSGSSMDILTARDNGTMGFTAVSTSITIGN